MDEILSETTLNYDFDLDDDDIFAENFSNISENNFLTSTAVPRSVNEDSTKQPEENAKPKDTNHQHTGIGSLFDCIIKDDKKEDLDESMELFLNTPVEPRKQDKHLAILSPLDSGEGNLNINSRFTPGYTPKVLKRKFPGPAGLYSEDELQSLEKTSTEKLLEELRIPGITSSQGIVENLLLPSWHNLQKDVSSCRTLLPTAEYHCTQRVLNEASKTKLPKHLIVPVLCVLIKEFKHKDSSVKLIDDTGEIAGKIYKDVLDEYKEDIKVGTALILKQVTFLLNILLLKKSCLASIYLEDGSVKHIHELSSLFDKEGSFKEMGCNCPELSKGNGVGAILKTRDTSLNATSSGPSSSKNEAGCSTSHVNTKVPNLYNQINEAGCSTSHVNTKAPNLYNQINEAGCSTSHGNTKAPNLYNQINEAGCSTSHGNTKAPNLYNQINEAGCSSSHGNTKAPNLYNQINEAGCSTSHGNTKAPNLYNQINEAGCSTSHVNTKAPNLYNQINEAGCITSHVNTKVPNLYNQINEAGCSTSHVNTKAPNLYNQRNFNRTHNLPSNSQQYSEMPGSAGSNEPKLIPSDGQNISNASLPKSSNKNENSNGLCMTSTVSGNANIVGSKFIPNKKSRENADFFSDDLEMDDFDELLCSLDEKSFLEEM